MEGYKRNNFTRNVITHSSELDKIPKEKAKEILEYTIKMSEKNLAYNPADSLTLMETARIYDMMSRFYKDNPSNFKYWIPCIPTPPLAPVTSTLLLPVMPATLLTCIRVATPHAAAAYLS